MEIVLLRTRRDPWFRYETKREQVDPRSSGISRQRQLHQPATSEALVEYNWKIICFLLNYITATFKPGHVNV